jgi:hypothetical protein
MYRDLVVLLREKSSHFAALIDKQVRCFVNTMSNSLFMDRTGISVIMTFFDGMFDVFSSLLPVTDFA